MKNYIYSGIAAILTLLLLTGACGKRSSPTRTVTGPPTPEAAAGQDNARQPAEEVFTEEDYRVLAMSSEERWDYLVEKYKELVFQYHGVVLDYVPYPGKTASGTGDSTHKVQISETTEGEAKYDQVHEEDLEIAGDDTEFEWTISFLERLAGDYTWNGTVTIADITPIAMYFEDEWDPDAEPYPCWPKNQDPHLDRLGVLTDGTYIIDTYDISTLAENYGLQIVGYNVYYMSQSDDNWEEDGIFVKKLTTYSNRTVSEDDYRGLWTGDFDELDLGSAGAGNFLDGDHITVVPIFIVNGQEVEGGENTRSDELDLPVPDITPPTPVLAVDPSSGTAPLEVELDGSESHANEEGETIVKYSFEFGDGDYYSEEDGDAPDGTFDGETTHVYTSAGFYYAKLYVLDSLDNSSPYPHTQYITVTGPPAVTDFTATPNPAETGQQVTFTVTASDTDGGGLTQIRYDVDNDSSWDYTESPGDKSCEHTFTVNDLGTSHIVNYNSKVEVTDNQGSTTKQLGDFGSWLRVSHAVPVVSLTTTPDPAYIWDDDNVEFDASASTDADGPNGKPTIYEFVFGDGNSYSEEYGETPGDGTFDGKHTHQYTSPGLYTATIAVYDEMYDTEDCNFDELHTDSTTVDVRVYGVPVLQSNDTVDDGSHHATTWSSLGDEPIAIDINPSSGLPGVVYYGIPASPPLGCPFSVPLFAEMTAQGWPATPDLVYASGQGAWWIGEQCDLEYDPSIYDESGSVPYVAATARANAPEVGDGGPDLYLYWPGNGDWQCQVLMDDDNVLVEYPVRLVKNNSGAFVHFAKQPLLQSPYVAEISDTYGKNNERTVESAGFGTGTSHDHKQYQDDYDSVDTATVYTFDSVTDYLSYETRDSSGYWTNTPVLVSASGQPSLVTTRLCALDFFKDSGIGVVWVDNSGRDLNWNEYDGDWNNAYELADDDVGDWCDFDYDELFGVPCVAYEQEVVVGHDTVYRIYLRAYIDSSWCSPVTVDTLGVGEESHLDLDVWNGYIYVAYAKGGDIYCAVLDFFNDNR